jgi:hypothetical protein
MASSDQIPKFDPFSTAEARGLVAICAFFMLLAGLGVAARFWSRSIKNVAPALDDWLVVVGLGFYLVTGVMTILQVKLGALGHHLKEVTDPQRLIVEGKVSSFFKVNVAVFTMDITTNDHGDGNQHWIGVSSVNNTIADWNF